MVQDATKTEHGRAQVTVHARASPTKKAKSHDPGLSNGALAGIIIGIVALIAVVIACVVFWVILRRRRRRQHTSEGIKMPSHLHVNPRSATIRGGHERGGEDLSDQSPVSAEARKERYLAELGADSPEARPKMEKDARRFEMPA